MQMGCYNKTMTTLRAWLPVLFTLALLATPMFANAQIVPECGITDKSDPLSAVGCDLCDFGKLLQNIINFMIVGVAVPLSALLFAYAGFLYATGGSNPGRITKAHKIFKNVLIGFLIAISGWLVINTIMTVVFSKGFFTGAGWYELECVQKISRDPGAGARLIGTSISDLIEEIVPGSKAPAYQVEYNCPSGYTFRPDTGECFSGLTGATAEPVVAATPITGEVSGGMCTPNPTAFGSRANLMSCICGAESAGIVNRESGVDVMPDGRAFSYGLYQINLTANEVRCPGQSPLPCPSAFSGRNYSARVINEPLFQACVAAAKRQDCNTATAVFLLNETPNGARNWSTYSQCN